MDNSWVESEQNQCKTTSLSDLPLLPTSIKKINYCKSITINSNSLVESELNYKIFINSL